MRTTGHQTPLALWHTGLLNVPDESNIINWQTYGIDWDGPITEVVTDNNIVVPDSQVHLTEQQFHELHDSVDPLSDDGNNGINHFLNALRIFLSISEMYIFPTTTNQFWGGGVWDVRWCYK